MTESLLETLTPIFSVNGFTAIVVGLLAVGAGTLVKTMTQSTVLAWAIAPTVYVGSLLSIYLCRDYGIVFMYQKEANTIATASTGMVVSLIAVLLTARFVYAVAANSRTGLEDRITDEE